MPFNAFVIIYRYYIEKLEGYVIFKLLSVVFVGLLFLGCTPDNEVKKYQSMKYSKMFQSVAKEDAVLVQDNKNKMYCVRCGMNLIKFYKTGHAASEGTKKHQYCSIHCLEEHLGNGITLKNPKVVDVTSLKLISVADAHYVVGSKKRGTMSRVSKYAFSSLADAKKFQTENGGKIMDFSGALAKAKEDFKHYR
jgi:hypothetical protein